MQTIAERKIMIRTILVRALRGADLSSGFGIASLRHESALPPSIETDTISVHSIHQFKHGVLFRYLAGGVLISGYLSPRPLRILSDLRGYALCRTNWDTKGLFSIIWHIRSSNLVLAFFHKPLFAGSFHGPRTSDLLLIASHDVVQRGFGCIAFRI
jgi:hypothetical protein